ncbi:MAG: HNH endonuclease [Actinomycetota bacterium]
MASVADKELDPERGRRVAEELRKLGVTGIMIVAAQEGYIRDVTCAMNECLYPEELGGRSYFEPVPEPLSDWMPTPDHINLKSEGGKLTVDNVRLAHRLCNRVDYAKHHGVPHDKDRARAEAVRERGLIPPRFRIMKNDIDVDTAISYDHALERAVELGGSILDDMTGASIIPKNSQPG